EGDVLVTAGTHSARYPDLYPYGIPIGRVSSVGATDTATFLQVQVQPYANLGSLDAVAGLVPKTRRYTPATVSRPPPCSSSRRWLRSRSSLRPSSSALSPTCCWSRSSLFPC